MDLLDMYYEDQFLIFNIYIDHRSGMTTCYEQTSTLNIS
jgi:hypothetical protein